MGVSYQIVSASVVLGKPNIMRITAGSAAVNGRITQDNLRAPASPAAREGRLIIQDTGG